MDLISLNGTLRKAGLILLMLSILVTMPIIIKATGMQMDLVSTGGQSQMMIVMSIIGPSALLPTFVIAWAERHVQRSQAALLTLSDFSLSETRCYSAQDREALLALIGEWYTDKSAGETDPARLMQLGHHNFEMIVRHEIAPLLQVCNGTSTVFTWDSLGFRFGCLPTF